MYIIPANSKKGQLIFNLFRPIDLWILVIGVFISFLLLMFLPGDGAWATFIKLFPGAFCALLVLPVAYYHNVLVLLREIINYYFVEQKTYIWRGWCSWYDDESKK